MDFAGIVKQLRAKTGLSQSQLAKKSGLSVRTIQQWEAGLRRPVSPDFFRLCKALDASLGDFAKLTKR